jgi:membrane protein implicated in regulation of membrane protease activity
MVAREYAKDPLYHGTAVRVMDRDGNEVAVIPVRSRSEVDRP